MYTAVQSLRSSVQITLARCSDCPVWYFPVQSRVVQRSAGWWSQAQYKTVQSSEVHAVQFSLLKCCPAHSSPVHSTDVRSSPFNEICARPVQFQFIPYQLRTFKSSIAQVPYKSTAVESSPVKCSAEQCNPLQLSPVPSCPVPFSPEQLTAVESSTTQSCSVKLGTTKCIAARPVKWSAIPKSPHWSPYKCISVQSCLQLTHQHNQERLLTALS